jgi:hypothetical protein
VVSTVFLAGTAFAQSLSMKAVQEIFRLGMTEIRRKLDDLAERTTRNETLISQCPCLDGKPQRKCPEE